MSKITAVITGRDFVKEVEVDSSDRIIEVQAKYERMFPGAHIAFYTGRDEIKIDHEATSVWTDEELSTNQIAVEEIQ